MERKSAKDGLRIAGFWQNLGDDSEETAEHLSGYEIRDKNGNVFFVPFSESKDLIVLGLLSRRRYLRNKREIDDERRRRQQFIEEMDQCFEGGTQ